MAARRRGCSALIGAVGAFVAPLAGRWSDSRSPRFVVGIAISLVMVSYLAFWAVGLHIWGLVLGVIVLDAGVQAAQVGNQSRVLALRPDARSRVNTVYMITYFTEVLWDHCWAHGVGAGGTGMECAPLASL